MFTKLEQRSWNKIEVARCRSTQEFFRDCAKHLAMQRCILRSGKIVKAFREGREAVLDDLRTGRSHVEENTVQLLASLLDADRRWTARELAADVLSTSQNSDPHSARHSRLTKIAVH